MKTLFLHHHLGLGDHIIRNGLVRYLSDNNFIKLFCKEHNYDNVKLMYSDSDNIDIIKVYNDAEANNIGIQYEEDYIRLGVALNGNWPPEMESAWDKVFYYQLNIPYDYSWSMFKYNKSSTQNNVPDTEYAFLCNIGSDGIDRLDYSRIDSKLNMVYSNHGGFFDNVDLISNAKEIHCINSSYIHLIDRLECVNEDRTKLFYHKNFKFKMHGEFTLKKNWNII
jgi:hypothetical protein